MLRVAASSSAIRMRGLRGLTAAWPSRVAAVPRVRPYRASCSLLQTSTSPRRPCHPSRGRGRQPQYAKYASTALRRHVREALTCFVSAQAHLFDDRAGRVDAARGADAAAHARRDPRPGAPAGARPRAAPSARGRRVPSMVLWGPPGSGKTTLAEVIARLTRSRFVALSAVTAGVADLRKVVDEARAHARRAHDPVHRRDPPLQQEPAGRGAAARRERHGHADRRDDREPVVRGQRRAAVAGARVHAARARRRGRSS